MSVEPQAEDWRFALDRFPHSTDERVVHLVEEGRVLVERMRSVGVCPSDVEAAAYWIEMGIRTAARGLL